LSIELPAIEACPQCATQLAPAMLACPNCARLVHADRLELLARSAREAACRGDLPTALVHWREALDLLPAGSKQREIVAAKITDLGQHSTLAMGSATAPLVVPSTTPAARSTGNKSSAARVATGASAIGLMAWKFKALLLGLTKGTTLLTMLLSLGVYWAAWGWPFALGLVLSIYVHEMGHVIALRRYGFKATAPTFIPGLGAVIRLKQQVVNPLEDAEIGLAGPIYGLGAAIVALGLWLATGRPIFAAIAGVGAWINLFNLLPIAFLDGGRGFHAMSRQQRFLAAATAAAAWAMTSDGILVLIALVGFGRAVGDKSKYAGNWKATFTYCLLIAILTGISMVRSQAGTLR
jgi:Zn-dependent protease